MANCNKYKFNEWYLQFNEITCLVSCGEACPSYGNKEKKARVRWDEREKPMRGIVIRMFK